MKIVVFGHPAYFGSPSMNGFVTMVADGMRARGHDVELWRPEGLVRRLGIGPRSRKWLGYIDQFVLFPLSATMRLRHMQGRRWWCWAITRWACGCRSCGAGRMSSIVTISIRSANWPAIFRAVDSSGPAACISR